jgi:hypothetical protein
VDTKKKTQKKKMGKKSRRRNGGRVNKRKNLNDNRERYHKSTPFANLAVKKGWDRNLTVKQNYANIGLIGGNLNVLPRRDREQNKTVEDNGKPLPLGPESVLPKTPIEFVTGFDVANMPSLKQQLDARRSGESNRGKSHMSELEVAYIEPLWEKYGNDWAAMWRDKKNYNQLTREKLRRRCERYQEWLVIQQEKADEDNESDEEDDEE